MIGAALVNDAVLREPIWLGHSQHIALAKEAQTLRQLGAGGHGGHLLAEDPFAACRGEVALLRIQPGGLIRR